MIPMQISELPSSATITCRAYEALNKVMLSDVRPRHTNDAWGRSIDHLHRRTVD